MSPDDYWSSFFGLTEKQLRAPGLKVVAHKKLADYNGAWIFKVGQSAVISVPADIRAYTEARIKSPACNSVELTPQYARQLFDNVALTIGPCYQGYYAGKKDEAENGQDQTVRVLNAADRSDLDAFKRQINPEDWEHSAIAIEQTTFAYFRDGKIVAAASLDMWAENVANMGLITAPSQRGQGCAKRLCAFATSFGVKQGYLMVYQTLMSNASAVAVAKSTGYLQYGEHLAIRFRAENHSSKLI